MFVIYKNVFKENYTRIKSIGFKIKITKFYRPDAGYNNATIKLIL